MAHLIAYAQMTLMENGLTENLVKAQCDFCGRKFGSLKEAEKCEAEHLREFIRKPLQDELKKSIERSR